MLTPDIKQSGRVRHQRRDDGERSYTGHSHLPQFSEDIDSMTPDKVSDTINTNYDIINHFASNGIVPPPGGKENPFDEDRITRSHEQIANAYHSHPESGKLKSRFGSILHGHELVKDITSQFGDWDSDPVIALAFGRRYMGKFGDLLRKPGKTYDYAINTSENVIDDLNKDAIQIRQGFGQFPQGVIQTPQDQDHYNWGMGMLQALQRRPRLIDQTMQIIDTPPTSGKKSSGLLMALSTLLTMMTNARESTGKAVSSLHRINNLIAYDADRAVMYSHDFLDNEPDISIVRAIPLSKLRELRKAVTLIYAIKKGILPNDLEFKKALSPSMYSVQPDINVEKDRDYRQYENKMRHQVEGTNQMEEIAMNIVKKTPTAQFVDLLMLRLAVDEYVENERRAV